VAVGTMCILIKYCAVCSANWAFFIQFIKLIEIFNKAIISHLPLLMIIMKNYKYVIHVRWVIKYNIQTFQTMTASSDRRTRLLGRPMTTQVSSSRWIFPISSISLRSYVHRPLCPNPYFCIPNFKTINHVGWIQTKYKLAFLC
jgi:hypothetical protein